nr:class I SAM-dependent methyltransferase [Kibdelosporangium sp. MJ126-NF4]CEL13012.1 Methyltransferase SCO0408 [Kibdelosporangium sp. MJ126-NF4]CTQ98698.1 Methyltransferase SCO0408 [Kibdelosporangium sp. MJ126-NF4]
MRSYSAGIYGDAVADVYDELVEPLSGQTAATVEFLADLARGGQALELGVGTGRVALPLAARGVAVHGIDASPKMLDRLRDKAGDMRVTTSVGDFGAVAVHGEFDVVYVVFNTFYGLPTQDEQLECVRRVAAVLRPGGTFVVEAFVPDHARFDGKGGITADGTDAGRLDVARHDPVGQNIFARQVLHTEDGTKLLPVHMRYVWPAELDLMARIAGLRRVERFGGWSREPFTAASANHVSVYSRTSDPDR